MTTRLAAAALCLALATAPARGQDVASPSCREGFTCPGSAGTVSVTLAGFDGSGALPDAPGVLDADEIQCALDCLDGDPDPDHVLAGPKPPRGASPVRGGLIAFDPSVTYRVQRSLRLPAMTDGPVRIDGRGARLAIRRSSSEPIAVLSRRAPPGATTCDVELMATWAQLWTIENLVVAGDGSPQDTGLVLHGSNSLSVRACSFASLGIGIELRFALVAAIDQCMFVNNRRHDAWIGSGDDDADRPGGGFPRCSTGAKVFTDAGSHAQQLVESGSHGAVVRHCRFLMANTQASSVRVRNSRAVVLDGCVFDGYRGRHAVHHSDYLANDLTIRNMYFETAIASRDAVILFEGGSQLLVEGLHLVTGVDTVAVDAAPNPGSFVTVRLVPWLPANVTFRNGSNPWRNAWRFEDVNALDLETPSRWTDGPPPRALVVDRVQAVSRPQSDALQALRVPVGSPTERGVALEDGQVWLDPTTRRLMYCCDDRRRPRAVR